MAVLTFFRLRIEAHANMFFLHFFQNSFLRFYSVRLIVMLFTARHRSGIESAITACRILSGKGLVEMEGEGREDGP